jgi:hypothetical protein
VGSELRHVSSGAVLAKELRWARGAAERIRGLIGRDLPDGAALVIEPARQVHTFGMRRSIDVVFCDRDWVVVHVVRHLRPARITRWVYKARRVVELPSGTVPPEVTVGDALAVVA